MFQTPPEHAATLEAVKRAVGIRHPYLDGWIYLFLSNKKFDVQETVAKLKRRDEMERSVFAKYTMTDSLHASMRAGIVQYIGRDRDGHPVLYFNTARDSPRADQRPERQANLDMFLSWAVRCDRQNPTAMVTWLINQKNASLLRNTDLIFQKDMALRISKFYPGVVGRMYICNMSSALTFVMKPLLRQLPSSISDCIFLFSGSDIRNGELQKRIDASVLPVEMGGRNDCDNPTNYERFAVSIESYFERCIAALSKGLSIKQMEMMEEFGVDADGNSLCNAVDGGATGGRRGGSGGPPQLQQQESVVGRARLTTAASEETLDCATMQDACAVTVDANAREITVQSAVRPGRAGGRGDAGDPRDLQEPSANMSSAMDWNMSFASPPVPMQPLVHRVPSSEWADCVDVADFSRENSFNTPTTKPGLFHIELTSMEELSFSSVLKKVYTQKKAEAVVAEQRDACIRDWISFCCRCVELVPKLEALLESLRRGTTVPSAGSTVTAEELIGKLRRCGHYAINLFPQTHAPLRFPLLDWYAAGANARYRAAVAAEEAAAAAAPTAVSGGSATLSDSGVGETGIFDINPRRLAFRLDCTTPDNLLLSAQAGAIEFVESGDERLAVDQRKVRVERRLLLTWPPNTDRSTFVAQLQAKALHLWRQLCPLFRVYIESKVGISIAEFIHHYGLLVAGGRIDETAEWYRQLFEGVLQYREAHRRNWLFYVFPPMPQDGTASDAPPTMTELLEARGESVLTLDAAAAVMALIEQSVQYTADQFTMESDSGVVATRSIVERYLEVSKAKIYIPYETQRSGVVPSASVEQHRKAAATALRDAGAPLQDFLFATVSLAVLQHEYAPTLSEDAIKQELLAAKNEHMRGMVEQKEHLRIAMSFARACGELQGSFGNDPYNLLTTYSSVAMQADGYALGLELLLAVAILRSHREGCSGGGSGGADGVASRDGTGSPTPSDLVPPVSMSSEDDVSFAVTTDSLTGAGDQQPSPVPSTPLVDVDSLMETITAMEAPAARLAALKRLYIY